MTDIVATLNRSVLDRCIQGRCTGWSQRVYIVAVVCILTLAQAIVATTWSPIVQTSESALHWEDNTIGLLQVWFIVIAVITGLPLIYLMENKGLRIVILIASSAEVIGSLLRTIPVSNDFVLTILNNIGTAVLAVSMPIFPTCSTVVAATWLPAENRVMATSAIVGSAILGTAVSFVLGPAIVSAAPQYVNMTGFSGNGTNLSSLQPVAAQLDQDLLWREEAKSEILWYLFLQFIIALVGWSCVILYFPAKPEDAPSVSASFGRDEFFKGLVNLARKPSFWALCFSFSFVVGIMSVWVPIMGIGLRPLDVPDRMIGWIGMSGTLACIPYAVTTSWLGQKYRKMKLVILVSLSIATVCFLFFALLCMGYVPNNIVGVFLVLIIGGTTSLGCVPTFFELTCECCFPVYEGLCTIIMGFSSTIASIIFFIPILVAPNTFFETVWVSWSPFVSTIGGLIAMIFLKEEYNRLNLDSGAAKDLQRANPSSDSDKVPLLQSPDDAADYKSTEPSFSDGEKNSNDYENLGAEPSLDPLSTANDENS